MSSVCLYIGSVIVPYLYLTDDLFCTRVDGGKCLPRYSINKFIVDKQLREFDFGSFGHVENNLSEKIYKIDRLDSKGSEGRMIFHKHYILNIQPFF